jgi:spore cortex formation protein SpoVR/YcgB (stage V sporulation)
MTRDLGSPESGDQRTALLHRNVDHIFRIRELLREAYLDGYQHNAAAVDRLLDSVQALVEQMERVMERDEVAIEQERLDELNRAIEGLLPE